MKHVTVCCLPENNTLFVQEVDPNDDPFRIINNSPLYTTALLKTPRGDTVKITVDSGVVKITAGSLIQKPLINLSTYILLGLTGISYTMYSAGLSRSLYLAPVYSSFLISGGQKFSTVMSDNQLSIAHKISTFVESACFFALGGLALYNT